MTITLEISEEDYKLIPPEVRQRCLIKVIEPKDINYPEDENWMGLKKASTKAYKELKKYEYYLRHEK
jgi:hypothetical protein